MSDETVIAETAPEMSDLDKFMSMYAERAELEARIQSAVDTVDGLDGVLEEIEEQREELAEFDVALVQAAEAAGFPLDASSLSIPAPSTEWRQVGLKRTESRVQRLQAIYEAGGMTADQFVEVAVSTSNRDVNPAKIRTILLNLKRAGLVQTGTVEGTPKTGPRAVFVVNTENDYVRSWLGLDA